MTVLGEKVFNEVSKLPRPEPNQLENMELGDGWNEVQGSLHKPKLDTHTL